MDKFLNRTECVARLLDDYEKHGNLIVAVDFDNTIYDFHKEGIEFNDVVQLVKQCNKLNFSVVIFTANTDHKLIEKHCKSLDIEIKGINKNVLDGFTGGKIYYNILLDDRAGLATAFYTLKNTISLIKTKQNNIIRTHPYIGEKIEITGVDIRPVENRDSPLYGIIRNMYQECVVVSPLGTKLTVDLNVKDIKEIKNAL